METNNVVASKVEHRPQHRRINSDPFDFDEPSFLCHDEELKLFSPTAADSRRAWERSCTWGLQMLPTATRHASPTRTSPFNREGAEDEDCTKLGSAVSSIQLDATPMSNFGEEDTQNWGRVEAWVGDGAILDAVQCTRGRCLRCSAPELFWPGPPAAMDAGGVADGEQSAAGARPRCVDCRHRKAAYTRNQPGSE